MFGVDGGCGCVRFKLGEVSLSETRLELNRGWFILGGVS